MACRRAGIVLAMLLLGACSSSSSSRAAPIGTTTANPHVPTFSLRPVEGTSSPPCRGPLVADTNARSCYKLTDAILGLTDIESAEAIYDREHQEWTVSVTVADTAESRFVNAMQRSVGRDVAIVIDGEVVAAPRVNAGINGKHLDISGNFDEQTAERIASGLTKPQPPDPRQRASVCTTSDLNSFDAPLPTALYRRLTTAGTYWFGRVHLDPPSKDAHPTFSVAQAWGGVSDLLYAAGIYDVVLANWTSDADLVMESNGTAVQHDGVLAWVIIGEHVPVAAEDVSASATVPGVPCYFGTSIAAVDAKTGEGIASAYDYSG